MNCRVAQDELNHDINLYQLEREANAIALEQMKLVEDQAKSFLNNHTLTVERATYSFDGINGATARKPRNITFGMKHVANLVMEKITPELCLGLHRGEPQALFSVQKIVGDAAHKVAFDALDLESGPFLTYEDLKEFAEQANEH